MRPRFRQVVNQDDLCSHCLSQLYWEDTDADTWSLPAQHAAAVLAHRSAEALVFAEAQLELRLAEHFGQLQLPGALGELPAPEWPS